MDKKTKHTVRAWMYVFYAAAAVVLVTLFQDLYFRVIVAGVGIYSLVMAVINFHRAGKDGLG